MDLNIFSQSILKIYQESSDNNFILSFYIICFKDLNMGACVITIRTAVNWFGVEEVGQCDTAYRPHGVLFRYDPDSKSMKW